MDGHIFIHVKLIKAFRHCFMEIGRLMEIEVTWDGDYNQFRPMESVETSVCRHLVI